MELLDKSPLTGFQETGFTKQEQNKVIGKISNYNVILAPIAKSENENYLTVLIPIQVKADLDKYFIKFDEHFKFTVSDNVLFAQTILKNYDKHFNYYQILELINNTLMNLQDKNIEPAELFDERKYSS